MAHTLCRYWHGLGLLLAGCILMQLPRVLADEAILKMRAALQECNSILKPLQDGADELQHKLSTCQAQYAESEEKIKSLESKRELGANELVELRQRNRFVEDSFAEKEASIDKLKARLASLQANATQILKLATTYRDRNLQLKADLEKTLGLLEYERITSAELNETIGEKLSEVSQLEAKVDRLQSNEVHERSKALELDNKNLNVLYERSESKLDVAEKRIFALEMKLEKKTKEAAALNRDLGRVQDELRGVKADLKAAKGSLEQEHRSAQEVKDRLKELTADHDRLTEENQALREASEDAQGQISQLNKDQELANRESEQLKTKLMAYKQKLDNPALFDIIMAKAEFLKNRRANGVDLAYEKTLRLVSPKLEPTHQAVLDMLQLVQSSSDRLTQVLGKPEYSPALSGFLTYGILLAPLIMTLFLLVRLKRCMSLVKVNLWMNTYNMLFCFVLFGTSFWLGGDEEPFAALRRHNEQGFEFLQIVIPLYYALYLFLGVLLLLKNMYVLRCKSLTRLFCVILIPVGIMLHYYSEVWFLAMHDEPPQLSRGAWAYYGVLFFLNCMIIVCLNPSSPTRQESHQEPLIRDRRVEPPALSPVTAGKHSHFVGDAIEGDEDRDSTDDLAIDIDANTVGPENVQAAANDIVKKLKTSRRSKIKSRKSK